MKNTNRPKVLAIIQARLTSTRLPLKVLKRVGGKTLIARICKAANGASFVNKVVVVWAHKFPHLDENDVLGRFREVVKKYEPDHVVRLTSDCPLLNGFVIDDAIQRYFELNTDYYSNHIDGFDVQVFKPEMLWTNGVYHKEHVISDFTTPPTGLSVNTEEDLQRVNRLCATGLF